MSAPSLDLKEIRDLAARGVVLTPPEARALVDRITELTERLATAEGLLRPLAQVSTAMEFPASVDRREVFVWAESGGANRHVSLADADAAAAFLSNPKEAGE